MLDLISFLSRNIFIYIINRKMKRIYRELSDLTKAKISQSMKNKGKSDTHKQAISNGLKEYWKTVPNKPKEEL